MHAWFAKNPPRGFLRSASYAVESSWIEAANAYEDWYLVEAFGALGSLGEAATSGLHGAAQPTSGSPVAAA